MAGRLLIALISALTLVLVAGCEEEYRVNLDADPQEGGEVSGAGEYPEEDEVTLEATSSEGYSFKEWVEDGEAVSQEKSYQFVIEDHRELVAVFAEETVEVNLYLGCREAIETGEPGKYGYVAPVTREITDSGDPEELLKVTLEELIQGPAPEEEEEVSKVVHDSLEVLEVEIKDGVARVNVCKEMEDWYNGSTRGQVFVDSFVLTAAQFPEVRELIVQVEGEVWDDGHFYWDEPRSPQEINEEDLIGARIEYGQETDGFGGEIIKVFDEDDQLIFEYKFSDFLEWAEDNWEDIFEEVPAFHEENPVYPEDLYGSFDDTAKLSPCGKSFAFSVVDYFAATHMSFVGVVNLESGEATLVDEENLPGRIEEFYWSPGGEYLAYALNTAKAEGSLLSNDHADEMSKEFAIGEEELQEALNQGEYETFFPFFRDLQWKEDGNRLKFVTDAPEDKDAGTIQWSIDPGGEDLVKEKVWN